MSRLFIDTDAHGDTAIWDNTNPTRPTPVLYLDSVDDQPLRDAITELVMKGAVA